MGIKIGTRRLGRRGSLRDEGKGQVRSWYGCGCACGVVYKYFHYCVVGLRVGEGAESVRTFRVSGVGFVCVFLCFLIFFWFMVMTMMEVFWAWRTLVTYWEEERAMRADRFFRVWVLFFGTRRVIDGREVLVGEIRVGFAHVPSPSRPSFGCCLRVRWEEALEVGGWRVGFGFGESVCVIL